MAEYKPKERFMLSVAEKESGLWIKLEQHFEEELKSKRAKLEGPLDPIETAFYRGQISVLKGLAALTKLEPPSDG